MKRKIIKILLSVISAIALLFLLFLLLIYITWQCSEDPREKRAEWRNAHKSIYIENKTGEIKLIIVGFCYRKDEIEKYTIDTTCNTIDTFYLAEGDVEYKILPIFRNDTLPFPKDFLIEIKDTSQSTTLKRIDREEFFKLFVSDTIHDPLALNEWILTLDSSLWYKPESKE